MPVWEKQEAMKISRVLENMACKGRMKKSEVVQLEETGGRHCNSLQISSRKMGREK